MMFLSCLPQYLGYWLCQHTRNFDRPQPTVPKSMMILPLIVSPASLFYLFSSWLYSASCISFLAVQLHFHYCIPRLQHLPTSHVDALSERSIGWNIIWSYCYIYELVAKPLTRLSLTVGPSNRFFSLPKGLDLSLQSKPSLEIEDLNTI